MFKGTQRRQALPFRVKQRKQAIVVGKHAVGTWKPVLGRRGSFLEEEKPQGEKQIQMNKSPQAEEDTVPPITQKLVYLSPTNS